MNFEAMYDDEGGLYGWTTFTGKKYGLDCFVWAGIGEMCRFRSPVVIFTKECRDGCMEKNLVIALNNMDVLSNSENFGEEFILIYKWVQLNQSVLLNHWNGIEGFKSSMELIKAIKKLKEEYV